MTHDNSEDGHKLVIAECIEIFIRNGIVHVVYADGAEIGLEAQRETHAAITVIANGIRRPMLFSHKGSFWISKDAREYARKNEATQPYKAIACVASNLGIRLMAEFYNKFYKPEIPYKVFSKEGDALKWLRSFIDPSGDS